MVFSFFESVYWFNKSIVDTLPSGPVSDPDGKGQSEGKPDNGNEDANHDCQFHGEAMAVTGTANPDKVDLLISGSERQPSSFMTLQRSTAKFNAFPHCPNRRQWHRSTDG